MTTNKTPTTRLAPSAIASTWADRQLLSLLAAIRLRLRKHVILVASATALMLALGAYILSSMAGGIDPWTMPGASSAALLAVAASLMTASALYPILRQRDGWLLRAVPTITHDNIDLLSVLGKLTELRSGETAGHNLRVARYTLLFAEAAGLAPERIVRSVKGALLHDVGKLAVPDGILGKPGSLTPDERREMEKHVPYGLEIIAQAQVLHDAAPVVSAHHEHYDGGGYPLGLQGEDIPCEARLFALVDVFDALTSPRVYKPALGVEEALAIMATQRGSHFDPALLDRFVELAPDFARNLPQDEPALAAELMERLLPYFELLVIRGAMPPSSDAAATGAGQS